MSLFSRGPMAALIFSMVLAGSAYAEDSVDPLDQMLARVVAGAAGESGAFYDALLKAPLYVVVEDEPASGGSAALVFAHREQNDKKIVDVYTSSEELARGPESRKGKTVQMQGRELLGLIRQTGCDIGLNTYSGHGGQLTAQKINNLLTTERSQP